ncbi:MAG TPA: nucleotidyltransferase family protein [Terriglobales bacterium]|nr:nucleotidyltransferase family protein [Terriglobales bacterium]
MAVSPASRRVSEAAAEAPARPIIVSPAPEFALLCACCSDISPEERHRRVRELLRQPIDWQRLADAAEHHGVIPRLYEDLRSMAGIVPSEVLQAIAAFYQSNLQRALWLTRELGRIIAHLKKSEIPSLPYKGPVLAQELYGDVAGRQFSDLDILVRGRDVERAKSALLELGYKLDLTLTPRQQESLLQSGYELSFDGANGRHMVELQWQILPRFYSVDFNMEALFQHACEQQIAGTSIRSLSAEDLLLVLCVHAGKHAWIQLSWLCDVVQLAKKESINWNLFWSEAERLGVRRVVGISFFLAKRLLGSSLPPRIDPTAESLVEEVVPLIEASAHFNTESLPYFRLIARSRERFQDRRRLWWRLATTPSIGEWNAVRLPSPLFPLYRVIRPLRVARRLL